MNRMLFVLVLMLVAVVAVAQGKSKRFDWRKTKVFEVLGTDFISPEEIPGFTYTDAQLEQLFNSLPPGRYLGPMKRGGYVLMPAPPKPMSVGEMRKGFKSEGDVTSFGWIAAKKWAVTNSFGEPWEKQLKLLSSHERVPNAAELWWVIETYLEVRKIQLFELAPVRTSSLDSSKNRIAIGFFKECIGLCAKGVPNNAQVSLAAVGKRK